MSREEAIGYYRNLELDNNFISETKSMIFPYSAKEIWSNLTRMEQWERWMPGYTTWEALPDNVQNGTLIVAKTYGHGGADEHFEYVSEYIPKKKYALLRSGIKQIWELKPEPDGTMVSLSWVLFLPTGKGLVDSLFFSNRRKKEASKTALDNAENTLKKLLNYMG